MLPLAKIKGNKNRASSDARCVMCAAYDGEKKNLDVDVLFPNVFMAIYIHVDCPLELFCECNKFPESKPPHISTVQKNPLL